MRFFASILVVLLALISFAQAVEAKDSRVDPVEENLMDEQVEEKQAGEPQAKLETTESIVVKDEAADNEPLSEELIEGKVDKSELTILQLTVDGHSYALAPGFNIDYRKEVCATCNPTNHNMTLFVQLQGTITCPGLSTVAANTPYVRIKLNQYYVVADPQFQIDYFAGNTRQIIIKTLGNTNCVQNTDAIFSNGFQ